MTSKKSDPLSRFLMFFVCFMLCVQAADNGCHKQEPDDSEWVELEPALPRDRDNSIVVW